MSWRLRAAPPSNHGVDMNPRFLLIATLAALSFFSFPAEARLNNRATAAPGRAATSIDKAAEPAYPTNAQGHVTTPLVGRAATSDAASGRQRSGRSRLAHLVAGEVTMLPHPRGCPAVQFCACGAAVELFGEARRDLWPVSAWYGFERASPGAGMVAIPHSHHLFVLRYQISGSVWMAADYNSGKHKSRLQPHYIAGMTIVNPRSQLATRSVGHRHRTVKHHKRNIRLVARR